MARLPVALFTTLAVAVCLLDRQFAGAIRIPFLPISTLGIAVAFLVGFKNNSAYDRSWEARKIWDAIVNVSRTFTTQRVFEIRRPTGICLDVLADCAVLGPAELGP